MIELLVAGSVYGVFVFFKAFQQRNVAFLYWRWVIPTSYAMSIADVFVVSVVAVKAVQTDSFWDMIPFVFVLSTGGAIGALSAMWAHTRLTKNT